MFYLFYGDDLYSKERTLATLCARLGDQQLIALNTTRLEGKGLTPAELQQACGAMPFLAPVRLVLVNDWLTSKPDKEVVKAIAAYLPELPGTTRLVLLESTKVRKTNAIFKLAQQHEKGYAKEFSRLEGNAIDRWIVKTVHERGGAIQPRAAAVLAANVGNDLQALDNEIEKLVLYRQNESISADDVYLLSPYTAEANIFEMVDAIGSRNGQVAMSLLHQRLVDGAQPFYLLSMIIRQFRLLIQTKACLATGATPDQIAKTVGMHPFVARKIVRQSQQFSLEQLQRIYRHLLDVDVDAKTGKMELNTALNLFVAALTA